MSEIVLVDINKPGAFTPLLSGFKPGENKTFAYGYLAQGYAAGILVAEVYGPFAQIRHLYVAESFRRMQIANTLLSEVTNRLKSGGVQEISACVCLEGEKRIACESLLLLRGFLPEERYGSCSVLMKDLYDAGVLDPELKPSIRSISFPQKSSFRKKTVFPRAGYI